MEHRFIRESTQWRELIRLSLEESKSIRVELAQIDTKIDGLKDAHTSTIHALQTKVALLEQELTNVKSEVRKVYGWFIASVSVVLLGVVAFFGWLIRGVITGDFRAG
jgi:hypothetical protein